MHIYVAVVSKVVVSVENEDCESELFRTPNEWQLSAFIKTVIDHQTIKRETLRVDSIYSEFASNDKILEPLLLVYSYTI